MKIAERYNLDELRNRSAELVFARVERLLSEGTDICTCDQCVLDLLAWTLNHVTPMYGTSLLDPLTPNPERARKVQIEIELALEEGLKRVRAHPKH